MNNIYVTPQGKTGHNYSLITQNELWASNDACWNYLPNAFYIIRLSELLAKLFKIVFRQ